MADSDKNIRITTSKNKTTLPNIVFTGSSAGTSVLTLEVRDDNTVAFTGLDGDVFSLDYNLSTGTIWSVNDKSGTPFLRASAGGTIGIAELGADVRVGIGQTNPRYKLDVQGWVGFASTGDGSYTVLLENGQTTGNNALSIRAANALRFYNSGNTLYTAFVGAQSGVNTTYILPPTSPSSIGASFLTSTQSGVLAWIAAPSGGPGGSGTVNSGLASYAAYYAASGTAVDGNANLQFTGTGVSVGGFIQSASISTGSFYVSGGVGITGNAFIGGTTNVTNSTSSTASNRGALVVSGGLGLVGNAFIGGTVFQTNSTSSIGTNSGAISIAGGVGIAGNAFIGGTTVHTNSTSSTASNVGSVVTAGGVGIVGNAFIGGTTVHTNNTSSIGTNSGAISVAGGVGIAGNAFIGGTSVHSSTQSSSSTNSGSVTLAGGIGIAGNAFIGGTSVYTSNQSSSSSNSGALTVTGGLGLAGNAFIGGTVSITNNTATGSSNSGSLVVTGGAAVGQTLSVGGSLNIYNGSNYNGFRFTGSASTTYTLPPRTPTSIGSSYLSSSIDGIMAWVAAPTSGGGSPGGTNLGDIQYKSGSTFAASTTFNYDENYSAVTISSFPLSSVNATVSAFKILGTSQSWNGSSLGTFIAVNAGTGFVGDLVHVQVAGVSRLQLSGDGYLRLGPATGTGFTFPVSNGSAGQVLTANANGVASWTTVTGGSSSGGTVYAGLVNQIAFYGATGNTVGGSTTFTNNNSTGVVDINHTTESTSTTTGALVVDGGAGIAKSLFVGTTLAVGGAPGYNIPNNLASFVSTVDSYNQLVIQNRSNGVAASANLVVNNNQSTDTIFFGELGMNSSNFSGTGPLAAPNAVYVSATSAPLVLGTTTTNPIRFVVNGGTTDVMYIAESGTATSIYTALDMKSGNDVRLWNSGNTFYTNFGAGNNSATYNLFTPTAPVGAGLSVVLVDSAGQMYFAPVAGIAVSGLNSNIPTLRRKRVITMQFCAGYTPAAAGPDTVILKIPDSALDGTTDITFLLRELDIRVETPSSGSSRIMVEKYSGTTAFAYSATGTSMVGGFGITLSGAGTYFTSTSTFAAGALVTSNDKLRLNWTLLNATHANFSIQLTMEQV